MKNYVLTLLIESQILAALSNDQYNLCLQKYTGQSTGDIANVVVACISWKDYSGENRFSWTDNYQFAATQQAYKEGDYVKPTTWPPADISTTMEDVFVLTSWSDYGVQHNSPDAPPNGFAFDIGSKISLPGASAIIYLTISTGESPPVASPCFIDPTPDIGQTSNQYTPRDQVVVFFNKSAETGSMITKTQSMTYLQVIDLTQAPTQTWKLSNMGTWSPA